MAQISPSCTSTAAPSGAPAMTVMIPVRMFAAGTLSVGFIIKFLGVMKMSVAHSVYLSAVQRDS